MRLQRTVTATQSDVEEYAKITGDFNPVHINEEYVSKDDTFVDHNIVHGALIEGWFSSLLYSLGDSHDINGEVILQQMQTTFHRPLRVGENATIELVLPYESAPESERESVTVLLECKDERDTTYATGTATVIIDQSVDPRV